MDRGGPPQLFANCKRAAETVDDLSFSFKANFGSETVSFAGPKPVNSSWGYDPRPWRVTRCHSNSVKRTSSRRQHRVRAAAERSSPAPRRPKSPRSTSSRAAVPSPLQSDKPVGFRDAWSRSRAPRPSWKRSGWHLRSKIAHCLDMANELGGKTASYVEVLECATMLRDARAFEKKFPSDMDVSIGQGSGK